MLQFTQNNPPCPVTGRVGGLFIQCCCVERLRQGQRHVHSGVPVQRAERAVFVAQDVLDGGHQQMHVIAQTMFYDMEGNTGELILAGEQLIILSNNNRKIMKGE